MAACEIPPLRFSFSPWTGGWRLVAKRLIHKGEKLISWPDDFTAWVDVEQVLGSFCRGSGMAIAKANVDIVIMESPLLEDGRSMCPSAFSQDLFCAQATRDIKAGEGLQMSKRWLAAQPAVQCGSSTEVVDFSSKNGVVIWIMQGSVPGPPPEDPPPVVPGSISPAPEPPAASKQAATKPAAAKPRALLDAPIHDSTIPSSSPLPEPTKPGFPATSATHTTVPVPGTRAPEVDPASSSLNPDPMSTSTPSAAQLSAASPGGNVLDGDENSKNSNAVATAGKDNQIGEGEIAAAAAAATGATRGVSTGEVELSNMAPASKLAARSPRLRGSTGKFVSTALLVAVSCPLTSAASASVEASKGADTQAAAEREATDAAAAAENEATGAATKAATDAATDAAAALVALAAAPGAAEAVAQVALAAPPGAAEVSAGVSAGVADALVALAAAEVPVAAAYSAEETEDASESVADAVAVAPGVASRDGQAAGAAEATKSATSPPAVGGGPSASQSHLSSSAPVHAPAFPYLPHYNPQSWSTSAINDWREWPAVILRMRAAGADQKNGKKRKLDELSIQDKTLDKENEKTAADLLMLASPNGGLGPELCRPQKDNKPASTLLATEQLWRSPSHSRPAPVSDHLAAAASRVGSWLQLSHELQLEYLQKRRGAISIKKYGKGAPAWNNIRSNVYLSRARRAQRSDEVQVCECDTKLGQHCGPNDDCLNRSLMIECTPGCCPVGDACQNQRIQRQQFPKRELLEAGDKGCGLFAAQELVEGDMAAIYVGEITNMEEAMRRRYMYSLKGVRHFYMMSLEQDEVVDATRRGGIARFANHSCAPNCSTEKWAVRGEMVVALTAQKKIQPGEEITYDYQATWFGENGAVCQCGAANCQGLLGATGEAAAVQAQLSLFPEPKTVAKLKVEEGAAATEDPKAVAAALVLCALTPAAEGERLKKKRGRPFGSKTMPKEEDEADGVDKGKEQANGGKGKEEKANGAEAGLTPPAEESKLWCAVCKMACSTAANLEQHLSGQKHVSKAARLAVGNAALGGQKHASGAARLAVGNAGLSGQKLAPGAARLAVENAAMDILASVASCQPEFNCQEMGLADQGKREKVEELKKANGADRVSEQSPRVEKVKVKKAKELERANGVNEVKEQPPREEKVRGKGVKRDKADGAARVRAHRARVKARAEKAKEEAEKAEKAKGE